MAPALLGLDVADPADAWRAAGFSVVGAALRVGDAVIRLGGVGGGIVAWSLEGVAAGMLVDGLAVAAPPDRVPAFHHPNGVIALDHLVVTSPDRARTLAAFAAVGLEPRRTRDVTLAGAAHQQTFFRMGEPILELVTPASPSGEGPSSLWGLAFTVADLDAAARLLGDALGPTRPAVQPGRRIASLRHRAVGVSVPVAFLDEATGG